MGEIPLNWGEITTFAKFFKENVIDLNAILFTLQGAPTVPKRYSYRYKYKYRYRYKEE